MKSSDYIIDFIYKQGTDIIFSFSGGMITHLEDSVFLNKKLRLVSIKHEQAGAFAAEGYARSSNKTGIAMGTSGPGATNMITGIASAYFDSVPVVYIAGQVNTNEITSKKDIRQTGFQEADIVSMVSKITKFSYQITKPEEIRYIFEKAFFIANHGRKGPVVLDIPMNIQRQDINHKKMKSFFKSDEYKKIIDQDLSRKKKIQEDIKKAIKLLKNSSRPVILIGGGVKYSGIKKELDAFIKKNNIPIVSSLMGLDGIDHTIKNYLGMIGSYGNREANITIMNSDLLLVLGSRLDIRQTGANKDKFCPNAKIIHIDIDQNELGYNIPSTYLKIYQELSSFFSVLEKKTYTKAKISERKNRLNKLIQLKSLLQQNTEKRAGKEYNMNYFFDKISNILPAKTIITNDVGQNQIRASQSLQIAKQQQLLNCGGMGAMGFSLPAAIGAYFGNLDYKIISISGDGGFQLNIQELETISHNKIPILIVVINNASLGMVREFQNAYFGGRNIGTVIGYSCPNISKIAKAYDIKYYKITKNTNIENIFKKAIKERGPIVLEVESSKESTIVPKVMFGNTIDNQSPELDEKMKIKISKLFN